MWGSSSTKSSEAYLPMVSIPGEPIPLPVCSKRRNNRSILPFSGRQSRRSEESAKLLFVAQTAVLLILVGAVSYAFTVSARISNMQRLLTDPNAQLPIEAVKQLQALADMQLRESVEAAQSQIAGEVTRITRDIMLSKLHEVSLDIVHGVADGVQQQMADVELKAAAVRAANEAAAKEPLTLEDFPSYIPYDLRFDPSDVKNYIQTNVDITSKDINPSISRTYSGPLDMEDQINQRAKEIQEEWMAAGAPKATVPGFKIANLERFPPFPFRKVKAHNQDTGVIVVTAPFADEYYLGEEERGEYWRLKNAGNIMIGMSAYQQFPREVQDPADPRHTTRNPSDRAIYSSMEAWLHGFRDPGVHLPAGKPRALVALGDFINVDAAILKPTDGEKLYDFIVNMGGRQSNDYNQNSTLTAACVKVMSEMGMKVLLVDEEQIHGNAADAPSSHSAMLEPFTAMDNVQIQSVNRRDYFKILKSARAIFVPGASEAASSPVTEALSLNVPALVHTNDEAGSWKYINEKTGVLFSDENDIKLAIEQLFRPDFQAGLAPREWFVEHWGQEKASFRLQAFLELVVGKERLAEAKEKSQLKMST